MTHVGLDYRHPQRRRSSPRQLWVGIALWIIIALLLTMALYGLCAALNDPNAWR